jgi:D-alanyl-D-alanine carboxypeptidase
MLPDAIDDDILFLGGNAAGVGIAMITATWRRTKSAAREGSRSKRSYGFIWGGKWYHYDTMHFEYRPELMGFRRPSQ